MFNASGLQALVAQYGNWFSYDKNPRAQIFQRNQSLVRDMDSMIRLMRWARGGSGEPPGVTPRDSPGCASGHSACQQQLVAPTWACGCLQMPGPWAVTCAGTGMALGGAGRPPDRSPQGTLSLGLPSPQRARTDADRDETRQA